MRWEEMLQNSDPTLRRKTLRRIARELAAVPTAVKAPNDRENGAAVSAGADRGAVPPRAPSMIPILQQTSTQLRDWFAQHGLPAYRAGQVRKLLFQQRAATFEKMTDLPAAMRRSLRGFQIWTTRIAHQKGGRRSRKTPLRVARPPADRVRPLPRRQGGIAPPASARRSAARWAAIFAPRASTASPQPHHRRNRGANASTPAAIVGKGVRSRLLHNGLDVQPP